MDVHSPSVPVFQLYCIFQLVPSFQAEESLGLRISEAIDHWRPFMR